VFVSEKFTVSARLPPLWTVYGPPVVAFAVNGAAPRRRFVAMVIVAVLLLISRTLPTLAP